MVAVYPPEAASTTILAFHPTGDVTMNLSMQCPE